MLIYFGFTHCPDICPTELRKMVKALELLAQRGITSRDVVPVFVSLDPTRDSVLQTRLYVQTFSPHIVGLTGTPEQCQLAARAFRVYSSKTNDSDDDYLVDHSIVMYLVDRGGRFQAYYPMSVTAAQLAERIEAIVSKA